MPAVNTIRCTARGCRRRATRVVRLSSGAAKPICPGCAVKLATLKKRVAASVAKRQKAAKLSLQHQYVAAKKEAAAIRQEYSAAYARAYVDKQAARNPGMFAK